MTNLNVVLKICEILDELVPKRPNNINTYSDLIEFVDDRPGHDLRYSLSGEKMKQLGWQPSIKLTERIKQVVEWSLNNQNWIEL